MNTVGRYQVHDKKFYWKVIHPSTYDLATKYVNYLKEDLPKEIKNQIKNVIIPFGSWETLFKKYYLTPTVRTEDNIETILINYSKRI